MMKKQMTNQLNMQNAMRERQIAMQIGVARERFEYFQAFYLLAAPFLTIAALKTKNPKIAAPVVPMSFGYAFQRDMAYGLPGRAPLMVRARQNAESIIDQEYSDFLEMPKGLPTIEEIFKS